MPARAGRVSDAATAQALVIAPTVTIAMAVIAVIVVITAMVMPVAVRAIAIAARVMPFAVVMAFFPLASVPVAVTVVIALAIPARTHDHHWRRGSVDRRRRGIDRRGRVGHARNANVHAYIDVRQRGRRCADPQTCNDRDGQPAAS
jgi:multidrug efflux pump subunit AcrB